MKRDDSDPDVVVAGGGVAGLACALALSDAGLRVEVLEQADRLGGRASSWTDATTGDVIDIGPHVITTEHRNFMAMLGRLGTAQRVYWQREPMITLLDHGKILRIHSWRLPTPLQGLPNAVQALRCVSWRDLMSNASLAWRAARMNEADTLSLDGLDALYYLRREGVTQRFIDWFWTPTCLALLNVPLARCSAASLMRVFRLMLGRSGYHFGFPQCGLSDLFALRAKSAIEKAGGRVRCNARVARVLLRDDRFDGVALGDDSSLWATCGVLALPPDALAGIDMPWQPPMLQRFEPSPYISTMLWLDRRVTRERFWARVWTPDDLNMDFYDLANIRGLPARQGSLIASNAIHAHEHMGRSDQEIVSRTMEEVRQFAPAARRARVRHAAVHRIPMAIPCPLPDSEMLRPENATPLHDLWLAGDWTRTALPASMESAARSGRLAAEEIAGRLGRRLQVSEPPPDTTGPVGLLRRGSLSEAA